MKLIRPIRLGPRDRRAIRLGMLVLGPILFLGYGVRPYLRERADLQDRLAQERTHLVRELRLVSDSKRFPGLERQARSGLDREAKRLFDGPNEAAASAALVAFIEASARESEVLLQGVQARAADTMGSGILRLTVELQGMSDLEGTLRFLAALEGGAQLIDVREIRIERREGLVVASTAPVPGDPSLEAGPASPESRPLLLSISAVVAGYRLESGDVDADGDPVLAVGNR